MLKIYITLVYFILLVTPIIGQQDTSVVQDAIYNRPFITSAFPVALGGYLEGNTNYFSEDGVSEGFSMEFRRFNIFLYSTIIPRVRFFAELEFEHGTEEIAIETAQVEFEFLQALVFRAGIIIVPIGAYNVNHDPPKYEFVERPLEATKIIPTTLSDIGFGFNGKIFWNNLLFTYDAYLVNGLNDGIILNDQGRTFLGSGKAEERFAEDNNGSPTFSGRLAVKSQKFGELGISYYRGIYNSFRIEGETVDAKRSIGIMAIDFNTKIEKLIIQGEFAVNSIEVPKNISEIFGTKQWGGYLDIVYPVIKGNILGFDNSVINLAVRLERIDYNVGEFTETGKNIYDDINGLSFAISFRPASGTVLKANYIHYWSRDALGNPTVKTAGFQFGIATYF
ncbi:MAG: hypothetical protein IIA48_11735 [Bacteroidetes bacterium]|nr:hypothetical protein [Bacteroidota bacterium]